MSLISWFKSLWRRDPPPKLLPLGTKVRVRNDVQLMSTPVATPYTTYTMVARQGEVGYVVGIIPRDRYLGREPVKSRHQMYEVLFSDTGVRKNPFQPETYPRRSLPEHALEPL